MFLYYILISTGQNNYKIVAKEGRRLLVRKYAVPMLTCLSLEIIRFHDYNLANNWNRWTDRKYNELPEKVIMKYNHPHHKISLPFQQILEILNSFTAYSGSCLFY